METSLIALFLAPGFEQIEALGTLDILRRAQLNVVTVAVGTNDEFVLSTHNVCVKADMMLKDLKADEVTTAILPGGLPGATNLAASQQLLEVLRKVDAKGGIVAAICAAPTVINAAGLMKQHKYTCYPSFEKQIGGNYTANFCEKDGNIITGCGPAATFDFAFTILKALGLEEKATTIAKAMQF